ncbi:hypothetical protein ED92_22785 [Amycolatopsis sp. MJM2582]|uniref:hypothetical protein n=1 Tax=Amycolatopsis sp. MJM2582 TaxID=1427749 RepID=UPI000501F85B|nr:hypothetical protein [Amycolatopsis sp. MJM2582]KFZ80194.1 hypothetical protein ED92_22785 [Amycolatopsis sp. MJM2582]
MASPTSSTTALQQALTDVLLIQTDSKGYEDALECSDRNGGGLVLTGKDSLTIAKHLVGQQLYSRPILVDRGRYSGASRAFARDAFDSDWITQQRKLKLVATMPDAGYVGEGDESGLVSILGRVQDLGPDTIAPLALHLSWLDSRRNLGLLLERVRAAGVPIAVALEQEKDPLSKRFAVKGLVELLQLPIPVIMLRCDVSALGALCFGATAAAVGTTTGLRHLYPLPKNDSNGFYNKPKTAAVVKGCLAYASLDKIDQAVQADRDNQLWSCSCRFCAGRTLDWLGSSPDPEIWAFLHSLDTLYEIRRDILGQNANLADRRTSWIEQCDSALFQHEVIDGITYQWNPPKSLGNWVHLRKQLSQSPVR